MIWIFHRGRLSHPPQVLADWLHMRRKRHADVTATVLTTFGRELHEAAAMGFTVDDCLAKCCARNWQGFEAAWLTRNTADRPSTSGESHAARPPGCKLSAAERVAQNVFNAQHHDAGDPGDAIPGEAVRLAG
ncbi:hypothetical protein [Pseudoxanthomonas sp. UTMC 1351]|uniref:hypothetical protein n=1 Tax=Pseudoxanthomonas sp. UTMC 1351 TaxID=2695853 RepID=UPI0034CE13E9